jgi:hypothetical protein
MWRVRVDEARTRHGPDGVFRGSRNIAAVDAAIHIAKKTSHGCASNSPPIGWRPYRRARYSLSISSRSDQGGLQRAFQSTRSARASGVAERESSYETTTHAECVEIPMLSGNCRRSHGQIALCARAGIEPRHSAVSGLAGIRRRHAWHRRREVCGRVDVVSPAVLNRNEMRRYVFVKKAWKTGGLRTGRGGLVGVEFMRELLLKGFYSVAGEVCRAPEHVYAIR